MVVFVAGLVVLPTNAVLAACEFNGQDVVHTGLYSDEWQSSVDLTAFNQAAGFPVTFAGTFHHLREGRDNTYWILDEIWRAGATPVANVEAPASAAAMASGTYDAEIAAFAEGVRWWLEADERHAVIVAPMQEMNGDWVRWGMDPPNFKIAYRRFVEIFSDLGMDETQVRWMFAPNGASVFPHSATDYWPGEDVVDVVGLSAYNFGHEFGDWNTVDDVLFNATEQLRAFARDKPFLIAQVGTSQEGGDREEWVAEMFAFVAQHPNHLGFIYFNFDKETNWTVWDGSSVADGWLRALEDERVRYSFPLDDWFRPGRIPFSLDPGTDYRRPTTFCGESTVTEPPVFSDVPAGLFYSAPIDWLLRSGLAVGYDDGTFRPDQPVTRAEALTLLWRLSCAPLDTPTADVTDVTDADWYAKAVDWGVATETVRGYPDGSFRPEAEISRAELATLVWRLHDCGDVDQLALFSDVPVRSFYGGAVAWMVDSGVTTGTAEGAFGADQAVSRGELATFLFRMPTG